LRTPCLCATLLAVLLGPAALAGSAAAQTSPAPVVVPTPGGDVTVTADRMEEVGPERVLVATGNVELIRGNARLIADRVEINRDTGDAVAQGRVVFYDGEDQLTGRRIDYNLKTGTGVVYESEARVAPYYRIAGERMDRLGDSIYHVQRGVFTTCDDDPPSWSFRFSSATADLEDFVYGTSASFWVKDIPVIPFFPFFAAAIRRERQTGFLFPKVGHSSSRGFEMELPFYWAISDSVDATIAPVIYTNRGIGVSAESRYVLSNEQRGRVAGFLLQETQRDNDTRGVGGIKHEWDITSRLSMKVDVNGVTDDQMLREYGDFLHQRSAERVESNVFVARRWEAWNAVASVFSYQDLTTPRPVELHRLPDLSVTGVRQPIPGLPGFLWELNTSYVNFVRDVGSNGQRVDLHQRVSRPFTPGGLITITPFVGGRLTLYDTVVIGSEETRDVSGPIEVTRKEARLRPLFEAGTDLETQFSRVYSVGGTWGLDALLHTIEPRMTYAWITGTNQTGLPLWTEGVDRIPDTTVVAYSLTNRVRARTVSGPAAVPVRWEALRLVLGHSYNLRSETAGDVTGTMILRPTQRWWLRGDVAHSLHGQGVQSATSDLVVRTDSVLASVGSRYSDPGRFNSLTNSLVVDITRYLTVRNSNVVDVRSGKVVEARVAGDIKFQCWALTVEFVHRRDRDDEIRFAVNLLGIGAPIRTAVGVGALEGVGER
jgi:LPS-assembly protein